jgi:hypothetical protein
MNSLIKIIYLLIRKIYDLALRRFLPGKISVLNGVPIIGQAKLFDRTIVDTDYKYANVRALRNHVLEGDDIVIVGGGYGVTSVVAARCSGNNGSVYTFEASAERCGNLTTTMEINSLEGRVEIINSVVGEYLDGPHEKSSTGIIKPQNLPQCEVLELDCEGAEKLILDEITCKPRILIVETHPQLGSETSSIISRIQELGYNIVDKTPDPKDGDILVGELI